MKITESIRVDTMEIRGACIKNDWYTAGTVAEYSRMFDMANKLNDAGTQQELIDGLYEVAKDIYDHSIIDLYCYGCTKEEYILNILFTLSNDCVTRSYSI